MLQFITEIKRQSKEEMFTQLPWMLEKIVRENLKVLDNYELKKPQNAVDIYAED